MVAKRKVGHNPDTGKPTVYRDNNGPIVFENVIPANAPTLQPTETQKPWYLRVPRGRGGRNNGNAARANDYIDESQERLNEASEGIGGERKP